MLANDTISRNPRRTFRGFALVIAGLFSIPGASCTPRALPPGGAATPHATIARHQAESYALDAVTGAVEAQQRASLSGEAPLAKQDSAPPQQSLTPWIATPDPQTVPVEHSSRPHVVIRERITTDIPFSTEHKADDEAIHRAQQRIKERLESLDPPVDYLPSLAVVKNEYLRRGSRRVHRLTSKELERWAAEGYTGDLVYVEYEIEVTAEQIRALRVQDRLMRVLRLFGGIFAIALTSLFFLRLDDWSKGYLTSWLTILAIALAGAIAVSLILI